MGKQTRTKAAKAKHLKCQCKQSPPSSELSILAPAVDCRACVEDVEDDEDDEDDEPIEEPTAVSSDSENDEEELSQYRNQNGR